MWSGCFDGLCRQFSGILDGWKQGTWYSYTFQISIAMLHPYILYLILIGDGDLIIGFHRTYHENFGEVHKSFHALLLCIAPRDSLLPKHVLGYFSSAWNGE